MSAISEIDIRDWEKIDFQKIRDDIEHARYENNKRSDVLPYDAYVRALDTLEEIQRLVDKQLAAAQKTIPALFKPFEKCIDYEQSS